MSSDPAVRARHVGKAYQIFERYDDRLKQALFGWYKNFYKESWALRDVSLEIGRNECVGFVGRNGSGKTTFLQLVCGITKPSKGDLRVAGRIAPILALGSAFDLDLSGRQNAYVAGAMLGMSRAALNAKMDAIADFACLGEYFDQPVKFYSSGMQARVSFAVCTQADPDIMVVDEALAVGDGAFQEKCHVFFDEFRKRGTLLFVSHSQELTRKICDRVVWIDKGVLRMQGPPGEVLDAYEQSLVDEPEAPKRFELEG